jgi:uncharacterized membrane protein
VDDVFGSGGVAVNWNLPVQQALEATQPLVDQTTTLQTQALTRLEWHIVQHFGTMSLQARMTWALMFS